MLNYFFIYQLQISLSLKNAEIKRVIYLLAMKQLKLSSSLYFKSQASFGGELNLKKRKSRRPLDPKKPLHLVLRAKSHQPVFLHQDPIINKIIEKWATRFTIKIYESSVNANHLHLVIGFKHRQLYQYFISAISGRIAQLFKIEWEFRPFTRIIEWGSDFKNTCIYVIKNQKEAWGLINYHPRLKSAP